MDAPVDLERPRLAEALATVRAGVGPRPSVHVQVDAQVAVRVEGSAALHAQEAAGLGGVLGALVLQKLRGASERGAAMHARVLLQLLLLLLRTLLLGVSLLVAQQLGTGREGALAREAGERRRGLRRWRRAQLRAGQAGCERTVVVMVVVVSVGVGMGQAGIRALLVVQELGARLEAAVAAQAREGSQLGGVRAARSSGGGSGGGGGRRRGALSVCSFILLLGLAQIGVGTGTTTGRAARLFFIQRETQAQRQAQTD